MLHQLSPATTSILYMNTASTHGMGSHMHTYTTLHPSYSHTHIIMYTYSINTCMTVYECTHTAYQVCCLANSVNHRLWTSPRSIRVKRPFLPAGDTAPHTYSAGPTVSHRHHTDMCTGRRGSLTTSHHTLQTPPYRYRVGLHALHSVPT